MATKIEGFAGFDNDGSAIVGREKNIYIDKHCTTVIHDGLPERVFTEAEVKAMFDNLHSELRKNILYGGRDISALTVDKAFECVDKAYFHGS
jgi:hypothetical protein